jgi:urease accessory protein
MNDSGLYLLLTWGSPSYPTGAFSYSPGLEWAVEAGTVADLAGLQGYLDAVLCRGGGWIDAVLFVHVWRAATVYGASPELDELVEFASALRGSCETALESRQQGTAFLQVTRNAWPHRLLDELAAHATATATQWATGLSFNRAAHGVALEQGLHAYLHAFAANLVSAGARLIPLGQTDAQIGMARLAALITRVRDRALQTDLQDLGTAAPMLELSSLRHETQYTRLFRS